MPKTGFPNPPLKTDKYLSVSSVRSDRYIYCGSGTAWTPSFEPRRRWRIGFLPDRIRTQGNAGTRSPECRNRGINDSPVPHRGLFRFSSATERRSDSLRLIGWAGGLFPGALPWPLGLSLKPPSLFRLYSAIGSARCHRHSCLSLNRLVAGRNVCATFRLQDRHQYSCLSPSFLCPHALTIGDRH